MGTRKLTAQIVRIIAGFDGREIDEFVITAFHSGIDRYPHFTAADWAESVRHHYSQPGARRIGVGDLIAGARTAHRRRTHADRVPALNPARTPPPPNFRDLIAEAKTTHRKDTP